MEVHDFRLIPNQRRLIWVDLVVLIGLAGQGRRVEHVVESVADQDRVRSQEGQISIVPPSEYRTVHDNDDVFTAPNNVGDP